MRITWPSCPCCRNAPTVDTPASEAPTTTMLSKALLAHGESRDGADPDRGLHIGL